MVSLAVLPRAMQPLMFWMMLGVVVNVVMSRPLCVLLRIICDAYPPRWDPNLRKHFVQYNVHSLQPGRSALLCLPSCMCSFAGRSHAY